MSLWNRIVSTFRQHRLNREIEEELESHLAEAAANGRDPREARSAFGPRLRIREESRDARLWPWLDSLAKDAVFGARQLGRHRTATAAAVLSLGLATGACTSAFRLIDALLLRPLPVADPSNLYAMFTHGYDPGGNLRLGESNEYPQFLLMRATVKDSAEMIAAGYGERAEVIYGSPQDIEKVHRQFVSGWMFDAFGLRPALGRLLTENDDITPGAHPVVVLSHDYWSRRFSADPGVIGKSFRMDRHSWQIIGVAPVGFTGTEPGTITDVFLPAMMHAGVTRDDWSWIRTFLLLKPGASAENVRVRLQAIFTSVQRERAKGFHSFPRERLENFLSQKVLVLPASEGLSNVRQTYGRPLSVMAVLVGLVLLIACANVANLLAGQSGARAREFAVRVSIGAGRRRLVQLVLVESLVLTLLAASAGVAFAWWAAPAVVASISPGDDPARLDLPLDGRVAAFGLALTVIVTFLSGLLPALRASSAQPVSALKGGDPLARRRLTYALTGAQAAFCCGVLFVSGLLVTSFRHLTNQHTGFSSERLAAVEVTASPEQDTAIWQQLAEHMSRVPGVERAALASWPLLSGIGANGFITIDGEVKGNRLAYFLNVSPEWLETMKIPLLEGRGFRPEDVEPGVAIVNEAFVREYFAGANPVGRSFGRGNLPMRIVGVVRDARYRNLREPITPTAYIPIRSAAGRARSTATLIIRTATENPLTMAETIRREVSRGYPGFHVSNVRTQEEVNRSQSVRERLLANLASFFGLVAVLLAGIGLYGVLDYSVLQRQREMGIRMALGGSPLRLARLLVSGIFATVALGVAAGAALGLALGTCLDALVYGVTTAEPAILAGAISTVFAAALFAALAPATRVMRSSPVTILRTD